MEPALYQPFHVFSNDEEYPEAWNRTPEEHAFVVDAMALVVVAVVGGAFVGERVTFIGVSDAHIFQPLSETAPSLLQYIDVPGSTFSPCGPIVLNLVEPI